MFSYIDRIKQAICHLKNITKQLTFRKLTVSFKKLSTLTFLSFFAYKKYCLE